jgi:hypothetical protein
MIGKHIPSPEHNSSFKGLNDYITGKTNMRPEEKIAFTGCLNLASVETATMEMESLAFQNKRCADPVMHLLLSWRENESPTIEQVADAVEIALDELSLSQCQAVYSLHQNTDNMHLHICVNRIDPDTTKAITPAGGWTRRAMEQAARRIEHAQGWQTENNTWSEINEKGELIRKPMTSGVKIPQKVQDMENLTGEQSVIRKAQNALKDKLKTLSAWEDFYNLLSLNGMKYEKKGSGAVITIDDVTVKASDVSRNLALSKLEKQLGPYREIHHLAQVIYDDTSKSRNPQPLDDANRNSGNWSAYIRAKAEGYKENKKRRERLYITQQKEREATRDRQKLERQAFAESSGKGFSQTRQVINQQRSILATQHAYERAVLKEKQKKQRESLKTQSAAFMSYEEWLRNLNLPEEAEKWRHRKNKRILLLERPNDTAINEPQEYTGLAGYAMTVTKQGVKFASQDKPGAVAFIDAGRVIKVYDQDDSSILACLQLAQQKWGGVQVNGTEAYKRKCAEIAVRNGVRIANLELRGYIEELERKKEEATRQKTTAAAPVSFGELKKRWIKLNAKLDQETRKIAEPRIAEAAKRQIKIEAEKIAAERAVIYKEYLKAEAEQNVHVKKEPPEPLLFGRAQWQREYEEWKATDRAIRSRVAALWEKAGGGKYTGYGQKEVERRLTPEYAKEEAEKCYSGSAEWKGIRTNIEAGARLEAERNVPETKAAFDAAACEIRKRALEEKRNQRITELDRGFKKGVYPPGTMGFSLQVDQALEVLKLERECGKDEWEALRLHPGTAAVLEKAEEYRRRERGLSR